MAPPPDAWNYSVYERVAGVALDLNGARFVPNRSTPPDRPTLKLSESFSFFRRCELGQSALLYVAEIIRFS